MNKASIALSEEQQEEIKKVNDKINSGFYKFTNLTNSLVVIILNLKPLQNIVDMDFITQM